MITEHSSTRTPTPAFGAGFTLLEVLVSTVILSILVLILIGMSDGASRLWRDGEHRRESLTEGMGGLQIISDDLRSAVVTSNPDTLIIESQSPEDPSSSEEQDERSSDCLFFLVSHTAEHREQDSSGDLCAVGYFIAPEPTQKGKGSDNLYRFHASGREVWEALRSGSLRKLYERASPSNGLCTELLARNIIGLQVSPMDHELPGQPPQALCITIEAINGDTARHISNNPTAKKSNDRLILRHLQKLSTIVHLPPLRESSEGL